MNWNSNSTRCDRAREAIADSIIGGSEIVDRPEVDAHLAECAECRAYRAECKALWASLGELPVPAPPAGSRARFDAAFRAERANTMHATRPSQTSMWTRRSLVAAGFIGALATGYAASSWRGRSVSNGTAASQSPASSRQYLLLLYDTKASNTFNQSPGQIERTIAEYSAWARGLREAGKLVSAEKLRDEPSEWFGGEVSVAGGDRLGGFFLISVHDAAEARQIAEACPHLKHGGRVELRAIQKT